LWHACERTANATQVLAKLLHSQLARASDRAADGALGLERAQQAKRSLAAFRMLLHPVTGIVLAYLRQPRHARPTDTSKSNATRPDEKPRVGGSLWISRPADWISRPADGCAAAFLQARAAVRCAVEANVRVVVLLLVNERRAARAEDLLLKLENLDPHSALLRVPAKEPPHIHPQASKSNATLGLSNRWVALDFEVSVGRACLGWRRYASTIPVTGCSSIRNAARLRFACCARSRPSAPSAARSEARASWLCRSFASTCVALAAPHRHATIGAETHAAACGRVGVRRV
jgi:hypothetical protein